MVRNRNRFVRSVAPMAVFLLATGCAYHKKKYDTPITKDTKQPDKVLFDKAINDLEHNRFEVARLTLNTLMNTYDQSEYMAKAKLAYADSWYREGGTHALAQAEAEYKDFILFYPTMEESAEAQEKVCMIHYKQMEKADRDVTHAVRAEDECRQVIVQFPNSKFATQAKQILRDIQEIIAEHEMRVGEFYDSRGANPAAANRFQALTDQYPLYSRADEALLKLGGAYTNMGAKFRSKAGESYAKLVSEYPLSPYATAAKKRLEAMELAVPQADPVAYNRMKYEQEHRTKAGIMNQSLGWIKHGPDVHTAAKSGEPAMTTLKPTLPASIPPVATATAATPGSGAAPVNDVKIGIVSDNTTLENNPDARPGATQPASGAAAPTEAKPAPAQENQPLPGNHQMIAPKKKKQKKSAPAAAPPAPPAAAASSADETSKSQSATPNQ